MSPSGLQINKPAAVIITGLVVATIIWFKMSGKTAEAEIELPETRTAWPSQLLELPSSATTDLDKVTVLEVKDLKFKVGKENVTVAYREAKPASPKLDILLLHGQAFKSETWVKPMSTLQVLSNLGYRAVAIDLPGYGDSPSSKVDNVAFMEGVIAALKLDAPVIVSPSMSGGFSLPYLFKDPANVLKRSRGYVAVAPVSTEKYTPAQYKALKIPTCIVYGEKDTSIGVASLKNLQNLPDKQIFKMLDAKHPCYLDGPEEFHKYVYNFLLLLK